MEIRGKAFFPERHLKICLKIGFALFAQLRKKVSRNLPKTLWRRPSIIKHYK